MKVIILLFLTVFLANTCTAQQLPLNTCGIIHIYDAAGNRVKRQYYCNNGGTYPTSRMASNSKNADSTSVLKQEQATTAEFQLVDALYPNPTTGRFYVVFNKALKNAEVSITDVNGKVVNKFTANGNQVDFDLSQIANGIYFIRINDSGNIISHKVIKQ